MGLFTRKKEKKEEKQVEATSKAPEPKAESKPEPKSTEPKSAVEPAEKTEKAQKKGAYFVSPHPDGGWQVKKANAQKALKRFNTKAEAEAYAKQVAANQGTNVVRQKKDGKIQKKK